MTWKNPSDYKLPSSAKVLGDYMLAYNVRIALQNAVLNLESGDAEYASPAAFQISLDDYAFSLTRGTFARVYAPIGWDPRLAAAITAESFLDMLKQLPVSIGDPNTVSVYDAWVSGKIKFPGGHDPILIPASGGGTAATGQNAAPPGSIL